MLRKTERSVKKVATWLVRQERLWKFIEPLLRVPAFLLHQRREFERYLAQLRSQKDAQAREEQIQKLLFSDLCVLNGPFRGLKYPGFNSACSQLYPKLIGSYELELHPIWAALANKRYRRIYDIGCAEGYYAVGFSLAFSAQATIYAFDTDEYARELCRKMALINGVLERVLIQSECTPDDLANIRGEECLILCDCEGYEKTLFNQEVIEQLVNCDLVIETHDFLDIDISTALVRRFEATHRVSVIPSIGDIQKAKAYQFEQTERLDLATKLRIFEERRPGTMEWLHLTPRSNTGL